MVQQTVIYRLINYWRIAKLRLKINKRSARRFRPFSGDMKVFSARREKKQAHRESVVDGGKMRKQCEIAVKYKLWLHTEWKSCRRDLL